ncbi:hypothetical protein ACK32A_12245 [Aeromonas enteropelogenes]
MAQMRPRSFLTGSEVDLGSVLSAYNARQFHHIYPKAFLASQSISFHEANVIANICFLAASENNKISDKNPSVYFKDIPSAHADSIFTSALIPREAQDGRMSFQEFISSRIELLKEKGQLLIATGYI